MGFALEDVHGHIHHEEGDFWGEFWTILTDPAHLAAEFAFSLIDLLILTPILLLFWGFIKRHVKRQIAKEHAELDKEHGVQHSVGRVTDGE